MVVTVLAGSLGLAALGIARAQGTNTNAATGTTATTTIENKEWRGGRHGARMTDQATFFKMTVADLQKELDAGKPMYQIAAEHGVTYATEKQQRLTELKTRLDDMVKVKYMTQAEADVAYQNAETNDMIGPVMSMGGGHDRMMR